MECTFFSFFLFPPSFFFFFFFFFFSEAFLHCNEFTAIIAITHSTSLIIAPSISSSSSSSSTTRCQPQNRETRPSLPQDGKSANNIKRPLKKKAAWMEQQNYRKRSSFDNGHMRIPFLIIAYISTYICMWALELFGIHINQKQRNLYTAIVPLVRPIWTGLLTSPLMWIRIRAR